MGKSTINGPFSIAMLNYQRVDSKLLMIEFLNKCPTFQGLLNVPTIVDFVKPSPKQISVIEMKYPLLWPITPAFVAWYPVFDHVWPCFFYMFVLAVEGFDPTSFDHHLIPIPNVCPLNSMFMFVKSYIHDMLLPALLNLVKTSSFSYCSKIKPTFIPINSDVLLSCS